MLSQKVLTMRFILSLCVLSIINCQLTFAQPLFPPRTTAKSSTTKSPRRNIEFEILTPRKGMTGLFAQKWGRLFAQLKISARIRQERFNEKERIEEKKYGSGQLVLVVAKIDRKGYLVCGKKKFRLSQAGKIKEWVEELKTFGVQGSPEGKPAWGLSKPQFEVVHAPLKKTFRADVKGKPLTVALKQFQFEGKTTLRFSESAREELLKPSNLEPVSQEFKGVSQGTALSMLLAEYGLCFRPRRTSSKKVQLVVEPNKNISDPWPFGWDLESVSLSSPDPTKPKILPNHRLRLAPKLFERTLLELNSAVAQSVLDSIERQSKIPLFYDIARIRHQKIDLKTVLVNYSRKRASWNQILKSVAFQARLTVDLRVDEASKPFLWISVPKFPNQK